MGSMSTLLGGPSEAASERAGSGASGADSDASDWSRRRADARRNHERVLAAASEVFTEHGLDATIPQVAARAGVGKATVYRSFPTKADLVRALAQTHTDWLGARLDAAAAEAEHDAYAAMEDALVDIFARLATDRLMADVLSAADGVEDPVSGGHVQRILDLAIAQGTLRADAQGLDITVFVAGAAHSLLELKIADPEIWRRYARLALAALRP
jgi:AcrR family transcriptional regulator